MDEGDDCSLRLLDIDVDEELIVGIVRFKMLISCNQERLVRLSSNGVNVELGREEEGADDGGVGWIADVRRGVFVL